MEQIFMGRENMEEEMSKGENILLKNIFICCQKHKRQIQYIHRQVNKNTKNDSLSILKCFICLKQENIPLDQIINISELFQEEDEENYLEWPSKDICQKYQNIKQILNKFDYEKIEIALKDFKMQTIEQLDRIHENLVKCYRQIQQNDVKISHFFSKISQKEKLKRLVLGLKNSQENTIEEIVKILEDQHFNEYPNNLRLEKFFDNLQILDSQLKIEQLNQIYHKDIKRILNQYEQIVKNSQANVNEIDSDINSNKKGSQICQIQCQQSNKPYQIFSQQSIKCFTEKIQQHANHKEIPFLSDLSDVLNNSQMNMNESGLDMDPCFEKLKLHQFPQDLLLLE